MSFKRLESDDFLISADSVTAGAWTGNLPTLDNFVTSSIQVAGTSGKYYLSVFQLDPSNTQSETQFEIAFGDSNGSGSILYDSGVDGKSPTSTIFGQFQNIVLGDENSNFTFGTTGGSGSCGNTIGGVTLTTQSIYSISIERSKFKGSLFPGTLSLVLVGSGGERLELTDNSRDVNTITYNEAGRVFQIVSGSNGNAISADSTPSNAIANGMTPSGSYGLFLPDIGTLILNPSALDLAESNGGISLNTSYTSNTEANNQSKLFGAIDRGSNFTLNSQENITSDYIFVRAKNSEFNYSANPSFISGSTGDVIYTDFINQPQTFITTIGLYNDANELLAVAKLSKPLTKDFTKEALVRVKLDF